ncbi:MAG TPA: acyl carrier protein [Patescibacteria group bacterium]|nr:acyl carrier protein [Patescibacteria group bacterium]
MKRAAAKIIVLEALDFLDQDHTEIKDETSFEDLGLNSDDIDIMLSFITEKYGLDFSDSDYSEVVFVEDLIDLVVVT